MAVAAHGVSAFGRGVGVAVLLLAACVSSAPDGGRLAQTAPPPAPLPSGGTTDASYDWHGLLLTPFGTLLKESPIRLHEVLLFHDESPGGTAADVDNKDCHAIDGAPPRFVGQQPDLYLLCFDHDRLNRIDASVRLGGHEAEQVFARACALWLRDPVPTAGSTCEGRDDGIAFSARLALVPGEATATLSMTLSDAALPR